jgi:hypothetical protein
VFKILYFTLGKGLFDYYDVLGYTANGVCFIRDRAAWPGIAAYSGLEQGITSSSQLGVYPNHLFSLIIGLFFKFIGRVSILYFAYFSSAITIIGNIFLGFAVKKFFPDRRAALLLALILCNGTIWCNTNRPITDPWAWTVLMVIFWGMVTGRFNGFIVGVLIGIAGLLRGQMFQFLPILPLLRQEKTGAVGFFKELFKILIGFLFTVYLFKALFCAFIEVQGNTVEFYTSMIKSYVDKLDAIDSIAWFLCHCSQLSYKHFPCALLFTIVFIFFKSKNSLDSFMKKMAIFSIITVLMPMICYSIITGVWCDARYYIYVIPMFYIVAYYFCSRLVNSRAKAILTIVFVSFSLYSGASFICRETSHLSSFTKEAIYRGKLDVTDLTETEKFIKNNFHKNSILVANYYFISAYHCGRNLVYVPTVEEFRQGKANHLVDGIVLIKQIEVADEVMRGWLGLDSITDNQGNMFICVLRENKRLMHSAIFIPCKK